MSLGLISLIALGLAIFIGYIRKMNTGVVSIGFAFIIGCFFAKMPANEIVSGWPLKLFFILLGMTFLFGISSVNGTLALIARKITHLLGDNRKFIPVAFFFLSMFLSAIGPGNISICALMLPIAMAVSTEEKIAPLLMASMVITGANAGTMSPIAQTGIISVELARPMGIELGMSVFINQIIANCLIALILYVILKGYKPKAIKVDTTPPPPFNRKQITTITMILLVVVGIVFFGFNIGLAAFLGAGILIILRVADENKAIAAVPWPTLILVCGVGMLVNVCRYSGGIDCLTNGLTTFMNSNTVASIMSVTAALMSTVSSANGVVMPTLIPTTSKLVASIGGDPVRIISAITMGALITTISPLSTLGALAVASAGKEVDKEKLFRRLFAIAICGMFFIAAILYIGII